jgi:septal ring factor EnvC (AmiA/AmiB activator)
VSQLAARPRSGACAPPGRGTVAGSGTSIAAPVSPIELAIYAAEVKLIMTGLAFLAAVFFAAALLFAFFFGTVNPRLRRAVRRSKRLHDENATLHSAVKSLKGELASGSGKIAALEKMVASFEREIQRLDGIRKRTDTSLLETKALLARLQDGKARMDGFGR